MAASQIFTLYIVFLFSLFLPHAATKTTTCGGSTCNGLLLVRFPFQLKNNQSTSNSCEYPGFDISCKGQKTILTLPTSGEFIVQNINYMDQILSINDPNTCLPKRFLEHQTSLVDNSPFSNLNLGSPTNYTFLNCSPSYRKELPRLYCLSGEGYKVIAVPTPFPTLLLQNCSVVSTALIPSSFDWFYWERGIELTWNMSGCRSCEFNGQVCGLKNHKSLETRCFGSPEFVRVTSGPSHAAKFGIMMGVGIPVLLFIVWSTVVKSIQKIRLNGQIQQPITELSAISSRQASTVIAGLDSHTIESYPKTQLGESGELRLPNDNTCPICLCEYQSQETLRTIPECNHYFHAECIDEWLRRNATCPVCRNQQDRTKEGM